ncbi:MAG TPA: hypothetical protein VHM30_03040 [Gemmatimonadaceae bacterium]|nr:hypothetical protein [Gemmatimonadaceae bacterium]
MTFRRLLALATIPVVAAIAACQDAYAPKAVYQVSVDTLRLSALTGTPLQSQSAVYLLGHAAITPGASESFDFALDIDASGKVKIIPRAKVLTCTSICQLGTLVSTTTFDSLYDAPSRGYTYDSTTTVTPGQTVVFVTKDQSCIPSNIATVDVYAKMVVDSVRTADRTIFIRLVSDPNCGFRGLVPGVVPRH